MNPHPSSFFKPARLSWLLLLFSALPAAAQGAGAPVLTAQPQSLSVVTGTNVSFSVAATGTPPLAFQWRANGTNVPLATNATLSITNVQIFHSGGYSAVVSNAFGSVTSQVAILTVDAHLYFRLTSLGTNGAVVIDHDALTGDDRGGIAVSPNFVFYTGDGPGGTPTTARFPIGNLAGGAAVGAGFDALTGNLRSEQVYSLGNGAIPISYAGSVLNFTQVNSLLALDGGTGALTTNRINLSSSIPISSGGSVGLFAGWDRIVIHNGTRVYSIALPSGAVTDLGAMSTHSHSFSESWAYWGIAEYFNGSVYLVYVQNSATISRRRVPDGVISPLAAFSNLADMASFTLSTSQGRWFFHYEGSAQFGGSSETLGSAKAAFTTDALFPLIVTPPASQSAFPGDSAGFSVSATGGEPFFYQWRFNGNLLPGANFATLLLTNLQTNAIGSYTVEVGNGHGSVISAPAILTIFSTPQIVTDPAARSAFPGSSATFTVTVNGAPPLSYQWRFNGAALPGATNSTLTLLGVTPDQAGFYTVAVSNRYGTAVSGGGELFIPDVVDDGSVFQITSLSTNGSVAVETLGITSQARGALALGRSNVFFYGSSGTGRFPADNLSAGARLGPGTNYQALVSNLRTEKIYALANGSSLLGETGGTVNALLELDESTATLNGRRIDLSAPIVINDNAGATDVGFFSGYDRIVLFSNQRVLDIALPSGVVTDLGPMPSLPHAISLGWGYWGVAEHFGGVIYLVYTRDFQSIVRTRVPDGVTVTLAQFSNLSSYMSAISVSITRQRWYFEHLFSAQPEFGSGNQILGSAGASFALDSGSQHDHFEFDSIPPLQRVGVPFPVRITARTTANAVATNFNGAASLAGLTAGGVPVTILPAIASPFVSGVWTGSVVVLEASAGMVLRADDGYASSGVSDTFSTLVPNDLFVAMSDSPDPVTLRQNLTYTLTVTNTGPLDATGVLLTNVLPLGVSFIAATSSQGACTNLGGTLWCDLGAIPGGAAAIVTLVLQPLFTGPLTNVASVTRQEPDAYGPNNIARAVTTVVLPALSINDISVVEGNSGTVNATFTVSLSAPSPSTIAVSFATANGTAGAGGTFSDYNSRTTTALFFAPGVTNQSIVVTVLGDTRYEANETFFVNLTAPVNATIARSQGTCTILDDDLPPSVSIGNAQAIEGPAGTTTNVLIPVFLSATPGLAVSVPYATSNRTATAGVDYQARSGTIFFSANTATLTQFVSVTILGDALIESNETFVVNLSNPVGATLADAEGLVTITTDDGIRQVAGFLFSAVGATQTVGAPFPVTITARDMFNLNDTNFSGPGFLSGQIGSALNSTVLITEMDASNGRVEFANVSTQPVNLSGWKISLYDQTTWPAPRTTFTLPAGTSSAPGAHFTLSEFGSAPGAYPSFFTGSDITWYYFASSANPMAVMLRDTNGAMVDFVCAVDADPVLITDPARVSFADWSGAPITANTTFGNSYQRIGNSDQNIRADWVSMPASPAILNSNLTLPFAPGALPVAVSPAILSNFVRGVWTGTVTVLEPAAGMQLRVRDVDNHRGASSVFQAVVTNDLSVALRQAGNPAALGEMVTYTLTVSNTGPAAANGITLTNVLPAEMAFLSATASQGSCVNQSGVVGCDLGTLNSQAMASVTILAAANAAGTFTNTAAITRGESDFFDSNNSARLATTVVPLALSIADASAPEGNSGTNNLLLAVHLSAPSTNPVTVEFFTANGTATAGEDYLPASGLLTFPPGSTNQSVTVRLLGDTLHELNETFFLTLTNPVHASLANTQAVALILNDDPLPSLSISDTSVSEGDAGLTNAVFTVSLSRPSALAVSVDYVSLGGTATPGVDFASVSGTMSFPPGSTNQTLSIPVFGNSVNEPAETFSVVLTAPVNASLADASGTGVILNDDAVVGRLDHFAWNGIASPQAVNRPIAVTLTARDAFNNVVTNFTGAVALGARAGSAEVTIGSGLSTADTPISSYYYQLRNQVIYLASEIGGPRRLTGLALDVAALPGQTLNNFTIRLRHTSLFQYTNNLVARWEGNGWTQAYRTNTTISATGWVTFQFANPFEYDGTNNLMVDFSYNNPSSLFVAAACRYTSTSEPRSVSYQTFGGGDPLTWVPNSTPSGIDFRFPNLKLFSPNPAAILPVRSGNFVEGAWTDNLLALAPASNLVLLADDGLGHSGAAKPFAVTLMDDIAIQMSDAPDPAAVGQDFSYTITVTNTGPTDATSVIVEDRLPAATSLVSVSPSQGGCFLANGVVTCNLNTIEAQSVATILLTVTTTNLGVITNTAIVTRSELDSFLSNNIATVTTTLIDLNLSMADASVPEGNSGSTNLVFNVRLSAPSSQTVTVDYFTADNTAVAGQDYAPATGTLIFPPGSTNQTFTVTINGDTLNEANESFYAILTNATNASISGATGLGTILNDDALPSLSISDAIVTEGDAGATDAVFRLTLSAASGQSVSVNYVTSDGTARSPSDYNSTNGTVTFPAGVTNQTIRVLIKGNTVNEPDEIFFVNLSNPGNASISDGQGIGLILNDDAVPGRLDHFVWSSVGATQQLGAPFPVTLTAKDAFNNTVSNQAGAVALSAVIGGADAIIGNGSSAWGNPLAASYYDARNQVIYLAGELGGARRITALALDVTVLPGQTLEHWTIRMKHTPLSSYSTLAWEGSGWTQVYQNNENVTTTGWVTFQFTTPFEYDGASNLMIDFSFNNSSSSTFIDGQCRYTSTSQSRSLYSGSYNSYGDPLAWTGTGLPFPSATARYPNIRLTSAETVAVNPASSGSFVNGVWTGSVSVLAPGINLSLHADDGQEHIGDGNPFSIAPAPDLSIAMTSTPRQVLEAQTLTYAITILNRGLVAATGVIWSNALPASVTFLSVTPSQGICSTNGRIVTCDLGPMPAGSVAKLMLAVRVDVPGAVIDTSSVAAAEGDRNPSNNEAALLILALTDTDRDGMPDDWERQNHLNEADPTDAATDADMDGQSNLQEYQAGTNPRDPTSLLQITGVEFIGTEVHVRFQAVAGKRYRLERTDDMIVWTKVLDCIAGSVSEMEVVDTAPANPQNRFYRILLLP